MKLTYSLILSIPICPGYTECAGAASLLTSARRTFTSIQAGNLLAQLEQAVSQDDLQNLNVPCPYTVLHTAQNDRLAFLLSKGADPNIEDTDEENAVLASGSYDPNACCRTSLVWHVSSGTISTDEMLNRLITLSLFSKYEQETLSDSIEKHCLHRVIHGKNGCYERSVLLHTTPIADAVRFAHIERLRIFIQHIAPEVMKSRMEKNRFIAKFMPVFYPDKKDNFREIDDLLSRYEHGDIFRDGYPVLPVLP